MRLPSLAPSPITVASMPIDVCAMTPADIPAAIDLWSTADGVEVAEGDSPAEIARFLERNPGLSTVAFEDRRLVAAVMCGHDGRRGYVYHLAVSPDCCGRGIGRAVMRRSLAELKQQGIVRALLLVAADNTGGHEFWLREGWEDMPFARPMGLDL